MDVDAQIVEVMHQQRLLDHIDLLLPEVGQLETRALTADGGLSVAIAVPALQLLRCVVKDIPSDAPSIFRSENASVPRDECCLQAPTYDDCHLQKLTTFGIAVHDGSAMVGEDARKDLPNLPEYASEALPLPEELAEDPILEDNRHPVASYDSESSKLNKRSSHASTIQGYGGSEGSFGDSRPFDEFLKRYSSGVDSCDSVEGMFPVLSHPGLPDVGTLRKTPFFEKDDTLELRSEWSAMTVTAWKCYIRPDGVFKLTWDACSMALILVLIVVIPIELGLLWNEESTFFGNLTFFKWVNLFADCFFSADIILNFFTAFYEGTGSYRRLVKERKRIVKSYLRGWFWIDLLATLPFAYVSDIFGGESQKGLDSMTILRTLKIAKAARALKVLRAMKLGGLMQVIEEQMVTAQSATVGFQLFKMSIIMILSAHVIACSWFAVGFFGYELGYDVTWVLSHQLEDKSSFEQWVASFYFAITTGTTVGYGDISATNPMERFIGSVMMLLTVMFVGQMIARIGQVVTSLNQREAEKMRMKREAMLFMLKKSVPKELYQKILRYIEHVYESDSLTSLSSVQFLTVLSQSLQEELRLEITGNFLRNFPLFYNAGEALVKAVCPAVKTLHAGKGDTVAHQGQANDNMFMIVQGEVKFMNHRGKMAGMLHCEDWFGARALFVEGLVHYVELKCETDCEFLTLSRHDFLHQISQYPEVQHTFDSVVERMKERESRRVGIGIDAAAMV